MMKKKLKDICDFYSGTGFPTQYQGDIEGDYPFYKVSDIANNAIAGKVYLELCNNYISMDVAKKIKGCILPKDTVVFAKIGEALKLNRRAITSCNCLIDNNAMGIAPRLDSLSIMYFYFFMKNLNMQMFAESTTVPSVRKTVLEDYEIEVPTLNEQKKIERKLVLLQEIIERRKQELSALDYLTKARFVEMFGMPGTDAFGWGLVQLGSACNINPKKSLDSRLVSGAEVSFVPMPAVTEHGEIDATAIKEYDEVKTGFTYFAEKDVLFAKITPCMENGKGAVAKGLHNGVGFGSTEFHVLRPISGKTDPYWIYTLTAFPQFRMDAANNMTGSAGQRRVPASFLENYRVSLPPIDLQNKFAAFVYQVDKSKILSETHIFYAEKSITPTTPKIFLKGRCIYGNEF